MQCKNMHDLVSISTPTVGVDTPVQPISSMSSKQELPRRTLSNYNVPGYRIHALKKVLHQFTEYYK